MHHIELMMAIIIASTTFIGLTGVVIGQTIGSSYLSVVKRKKLRTRLVYFPLAFGVVATMCAVGWLSGQNPLLELIASVFFGFQMVSFWGIAFRFWVIEK
jgi:hypothetical protein